MENSQLTIRKILAADDEYSLKIFSNVDIAWINQQLIDRKGIPYINCIIRKKPVRAYPEEIVRQLFVRKLIKNYGYSQNRIQVEKGVVFGSNIAPKRADIVVSQENDIEAAYIIVEVKKPNRKDGIEQLKSYCNAEGSPIAVWTNGAELVLLHRVDPNLYRSLTDLPTAMQTIESISSMRLTLEQLSEIDKLRTEKMSLKDVILDLENLVLANAGVDAFEEIFKLIYAKLFDEWKAAHPDTPFLQFRVLDDQDQYLFYQRINSLFNSAKQQWPGVFLPGEKIDLTPSHLATCVSFLQDIKLFNSNLQIIDEAFEYLMTEVGKGKKGQYFTPRHVIDMCVKMINPKLEEYVIDTAAGSCGFTVHSFFHVWGSQLSAIGPNEWQREYASTHVFGIDFDQRAVKIAKALNLIAGDGRTNVYRANTLAPFLWNDEIKVGLKHRLRTFESDNELNQKNQREFIYFNFDVILTNPPFAGDIRERRILSHYELSKRGKDKLYNSQARDVLFLERNFQFLRPGGRMAIVLPQGRFNNYGDSYIRDYIKNNARILAVVGLDNNTFKPHTGTKTSILFVQKWNDNPDLGPLCPYNENYPIFFATSSKSGKDSSGNYVYKSDDDGNRVIDDHGHLVIDHDLDQIADAFIEFADKNNFSFINRD